MQDKTKKKKEKKESEVQDLEPKKDAKGGLLPAVSPSQKGSGKLGNQSGDIIAI